MTQNRGVGALAEICVENEKTLHRYAELLGEANERARIIGPSDPAVIYSEHISDALMALPYLEKISSGSSFVDVGSGGGLPGLAWGICRPDLNGVLLDSVGKKIELVKEIIETLGVKNIRAINARSEDFVRDAREFFDVAAARAVADSVVLAEYLSPFVKIGGCLLAFKGRSAAAELDIPPSKWGVLGLGAPTILPYQILDKKLNLVIWKKISPCPKRYPRKPGEAKKNPWFAAPARKFYAQRSAD
jgi:16S rRNA (guanine527-N7)-methyltransferase